jgi:hypothetical protein
LDSENLGLVLNGMDINSKTKLSKTLKTAKSEFLVFLKFVAKLRKALNPSNYKAIFNYNN